LATAATDSTVAESGLYYPLANDATTFAFVAVPDYSGEYLNTILVFSKEARGPQVYAEESLAVVGKVYEPYLFETSLGTEIDIPSVEFTSLVPFLGNPQWGDVETEPSKYVDRRSDTIVILVGEIGETAVRTDLNATLFVFDVDSTLQSGTVLFTPTLESEIETGQRLLVWGRLRLAQSDNPWVLVVGTQQFTGSYSDLSPSRLICLVTVSDDSCRPSATATQTSTLTPTPTPTPTPTATPLPGSSRLLPLSVGVQGAITQSGRTFEVTVLQIVRGETAWQMISDQNRFNDPPNEGHEYILFRVNVNYIQGPSDQTTSVNWLDFDVVSQIGSDYDMPFLVVPIPELDGRVFPGSSANGWLAWEVLKNDLAPVAVFGADSSLRGGLWFKLDTVDAATPTPTPSPVPRYLLISVVIPQADGSLEINPPSSDGRYEHGALVVLVASCDLGFQTWTGDLPQGVSPTSNAIPVTMDRERRLVALCNTE